MRLTNRPLFAATFASLVLLAGCGGPDASDTDVGAGPEETEVTSAEPIAESEQELIVCQGTWRYGLTDSGRSAYAACSYSTSKSQIRMRVSCKSGSKYWESYGRWVALNGGGYTVAGCGSAALIGRSVQSRY